MKQLEILTGIYETLNKFFDGQFVYGIAGVATDKLTGKPKTWVHPVGWFNKTKDPDNIYRIAKASDMQFCLDKNNAGCCVYVQPAYDVEDRFILFDDFNAEKATAWAKRPGTLVIKTSPGCFQVWRKLDRPMNNDEKKEYLRRENADVAAHPEHRWGRCPGFRNKKARHAPNFPIARLTSVSEGLANLAIAEPTRYPKPEPARAYRPANVNNYPTRNDYEKGNESITDFCYTMALLRRGASDDVITSRILTERQNWTNKPCDNQQIDYIKRTINNARLKMAA